jgi:hypothetical protein
MAVLGGKGSLLLPLLLLLGLLATAFAAAAAEEGDADPLYRWVLLLLPVPLPTRFLPPLFPRWRLGRFVLVARNARSSTQPALLLLYHDIFLV